MSKTIEYTEAIVPYRHEELMAKVAAQLTDKRYQHCLRVEETARQLAADNGVDVELAGIAGYYTTTPSNAMIKHLFSSLRRMAWTPTWFRMGTGSGMAMLALN